LTSSPFSILKKNSLPLEEGYQICRCLVDDSRGRFVELILHRQTDRQTDRFSNLINKKERVKKEACDASLFFVRVAMTKIIQIPYILFVNGEDNIDLLGGGGSGNRCVDAAATEESSPPNWSGIISPALTGISINNATPTNQNAGGGAAHENRPPYYALAFIMKL
jgi:hypothetical protein